jgi:hypothetical protein
LVWSRNAKDLGHFFPELVELASQLSADTVLDGEIVRPIETGVSFIQLQQRLTVRHNERERVGRESPVAFVAFDPLQHGGHDVRCHVCRNACGVTSIRGFRGRFGVTRRGRIFLARPRMVETKPRQMGSSVALCQHIA